EMPSLRISASLLGAHDLFRKPVSTFRGSGASSTRLSAEERAGISALQYRRELLALREPNLHLPHRFQLPYRNTAAHCRDRFLCRCNVALNPQATTMRVGIEQRGDTFTTRWREQTSHALKRSLAPQGLCGCLCEQGDTPCAL